MDKENEIVAECGRCGCAIERYELLESSREPAGSTAGDEIIETVFQYIDRMTDVVPSDPADLILAEFTRDIVPILERYVAEASR